ncbi:hypothetical protein [Proteus mirabilis]|uniref:hypothetical protein n=2 Tax=Proteus mirabilis TaxID=584 RepID=UPI001E500BAA|nr:hypothetical protein [Proteus mirabilis]MCD4609984.1 hypothetical protein [Proteus mirabilis]
MVLKKRCFRQIAPALIFSLLTIGTFSANANIDVRDETLFEAHQRFKTQIINDSFDNTEAPWEAPAEIFNVVKYPAKLGDMYAYLTPPPANKKNKLPAVIWLNGGYGGIGGDDYFWTPQPVENERNNIRTMFAYEISYNQSNLRLLEGTKNAGFDKEKCQAEICTASPVELNVFAGIRLMILNSLRDDVYTIYLPQIYLLEPKEVSLIMNYYYSQKELLQSSKAIQIGLAQNRDNKKWLEEKTYLLTHSFENEYLLGEQILSMYKAYIPDELVNKR